ncbi:MAG: uroporphyrinogen decarboxylase family protein [Lachnospiraceae bacterium]|nr:uroporphyrinogen decarboxylase family protein [Lachnospiraceae bacterium]MDO4734657.1 uroporphyrinogen decarboxylase family protein [Lachnospiraceae bacterium]
MPENNAPQFDFKANYLNFLHHKPTTLIPNSFVGNSIMGFGAINGPAIEKGAQFGDCLDGFGIRWEYPSTGDGAAIPANDVFVLKDICDWREVVKIPDPAQFDWKAEYQLECQILGEPNRETSTVDFGFGNGVFERFAALMGFEEALYSIAAEPEEVYALMEAITDYKVAALDYIIDAFHPDTITYFDDVATERAPFISLETYRKIIKPHHKRFAQECINRGIMPIFHCCGKAESLVEDMIDCGWTAWSSVQSTNDIETLIQKYGDQIGFVGGYNSTGPVCRQDATQEMIDAEVRRCLESYGKYHKAYCFLGFKYSGTPDPANTAKEMGKVIESVMRQSFEILMSEMQAQR